MSFLPNPSVESLLTGYHQLHIHKGYDNDDDDDDDDDDDGDDDDDDMQATGF